jgi:hypothetical protein
MFLNILESQHSKHNCNAKLIFINEARVFADRYLLLQTKDTYLYLLVQ